MPSSRSRSASASKAPPAAPQSPPPALLQHPDTLHVLAKTQLVRLCGRVGLKDTGKKADLVARLQEFAAANVAPSGPTSGCLVALRPVDDRASTEEPESDCAPESAEPDTLQASSSSETVTQLSETVAAIDQPESPVPVRRGARRTTRSASKEVKPLRITRAKTQAKLALQEEEPAMAEADEPAQVMEEAQPAEQPEVSSEEAEEVQAEVEPVAAAPATPSVPSSPAPQRKASASVQTPVSLRLRTSLQSIKAALTPTRAASTPKAAATPIMAQLQTPLKSPAAFVVHLSSPAIPSTPLLQPLFQTAALLSSPAVQPLSPGEAGNTSIISHLDPAQPSIRLVGGHVSMEPLDAFVPATDYGASITAADFGPVLRHQAEGQDTAHSGHSRNGSANSRLMGSLRGLKASAAAKLKGNAGKRKRTEDGEHNEMSFVMLDASVNMPATAADCSMADASATMSYVAVEAEDTSMRSASRSPSPEAEPPVLASTAPLRIVKASSPGPATAFSPTAPLRIIKAKPRPSRALLALQSAASSSSLQPVAAAQSVAPSTSTATFVPPSASSADFSAAGAAVLAEMNARLIAAGRAPLKALPTPGQWSTDLAQRKAALPPPLPGAERFEMKHSKTFGSMASITEHYAAKRGTASAASSLRAKPGVPASAKAQVREQEQRMASSSSKRAKLNTTAGPCAKAALSEARKLVPAAAKLAPSKGLGGRFVGAMRGMVAGKSTTSPAKPVAAAAPAAPKPASNAGSLGSMTRSGSGSLKALGRSLSNSSNKARDTIVTSASSAARALSTRTVDSASVGRKASAAPIPRYFASSVSSTASRAAYVASTATASTAALPAHPLVKKKPVFDLAASLARKPTGYTPYAVSETLQVLHAGASATPARAADESTKAKATSPSRKSHVSRPTIASHKRAAAVDAAIGRSSNARGVTRKTRSSLAAAGLGSRVTSPRQSSAVAAAASKTLRRVPAQAQLARTAATLAALNTPTGSPSTLPLAIGRASPSKIRLEELASPRGRGAGGLREISQVEAEAENVLVAA